LVARLVASARIGLRTGVVPSLPIGLLLGRLFRRFFLRLLRLFGLVQSEALLQIRKV
jgi:hypothetical protein